MARIPTIVVPGQYNAKTLPLGRPDIAAVNYGVTPRNVSARLEKLWAHRGEKEGGSKVLFDKIAQWASPAAIKARGGNPADKQWQLWQQYLDTGKIAPAMHSKLAVTALGLGLSEAARNQQHKHPFLKSVLGQILTIGAEITAAVVGGPWAAAAVGAGVGYVKDHSLLGTVIGGVQGYGVGKFVGTLGAEWSAAGGFQELAANPGVFVKTLGYNVAGDVVSNFGPGALVGVASAGVGAFVGPRVAGGSKAPAGGGKAISPDDYVNSLDPSGDGKPGTVKTQTPAQAARATISSNTEQQRSARRMSLLAVGAHTGAGDPRRLTNFSPKAAPVRTASGRVPIPMTRAAA